MVHLDIEWDDNKAAENLAKHGVSFDKARSGYDSYRRGERNHMNGDDTTEHEPRASSPDDGWAQFDRMTAAEKHAAALAGADAQPISPDNIGMMRRTPQVRVIRRALGLTTDEFSARFRIPLDMLRDWERGATQPDAAARAYLIVIASIPSAVAEALQTTR